MATRQLARPKPQATQTTKQGQPATPLAELRALAARRPIALFLALAFGLAYPIMALGILAKYGVIPGASLPARFGMDLEEAASGAMVLLGLLPATVLVTALEGGRPAVRALFRRIFRWRIGLVWWLGATAALPAITVAIALLLGDAVRAPGAGVLAREVVAIAVAFLFVNLWEETAWAGFLQTRLERRHNLFVAALLTGIAFGAIHLPVRIISGETALAPAALATTMAIVTIFGCVVRPLIGVVLRGTGDSVFAVALLHTFFNRSNNVDGIAADLLVGTHRSDAALLAWVLLTVVVGVAIRRRLGRAHRQELDALNGEGMASSAELAGTPR